MTIQDKCVHLMKEKGISYAELDRRTSYTRSTLQRYFTDPNKEITVDMIQELAPIFEVDAKWLAGWSESKEKKSSKAHRIPVYGKVAAGIPLEMVEDILDHEEIPAKWGDPSDFFCLQIKGKSMQPKMDEGDVVVVKKQADADSNDIVIFTVNGENASCKRLKKSEHGLAFIPLNTDFDPMIYSWEQVEELPVQILGRVVELRAKF